MDNFWGPHKFIIEREVSLCTCNGRLNYIVCAWLWTSIMLKVLLIFSLFHKGNCLNNYKPNKPVKPRYLPTAVFNHTEDYGNKQTNNIEYIIIDYNCLVLMGEEGQNMVFCWETRTTQSFRPLFTCKKYCSVVVSRSIVHVCCM